MKSMLIAAITLASTVAFADRYVTVTVCDRGESGQQCETVTYKERESTGVPADSYNPSNEYYPQPGTGYHTRPSTGNQNNHGNNPSNPEFEAP
ncbi:hypothetical protein [Pseudobdellovibrio sp. HCB154]|uniref:hypothetical protein n=1 Tax=Pseudobdellovibrio sp. HCB154 TaxID=3386277 RepID=UPI0039176073